MTGNRAAPLQDFVDWCRKHITGDEKGQAQIYIDHLFRALGHKGCLDVGGEAEYRIRKAKESGGGTAFADYVWKPHVLIEMKKRGTDLSRHYRQAFDYWIRLVPDRPRYVILCNFDEFRVYDFETQMDAPVDRLPLTELPDRWGPLAFLFPSHDRPTFGNDLEQVTRDAADKLARCFNKLITRQVPREEAQRFILQMLVALFAEDIDLLPRYFVAKLLDDCKSPSDSFDLLGDLFDAMNSPGKPKGGRYKEVEYFNGGLFREPARLELYDDELNQLRVAAKADWSKVRPEIFGTLFEHSLEAEERHAYGGHFTTAVDIMKIVGPTIVEPWREAIEQASKGTRPIQKLEKLHGRMVHYRVLDPACGSGNFLYLAYRELKRLEVALLERIDELSKKKDAKGHKQQPRLVAVTARQFFGIDINPFAVEIAKVTMMIARKLAIDELGTSEQALPLDDLDGNFTAGDALITPLSEAGDALPTMLFSELEQDPFTTGSVIPTSWPAADVIIGNPPFLDARKTTIEHGRKYVGHLRSLYPEITRRADYCVYWIRRVHDHLPACTKEDPVAGRAGLVGTQNIRNNEAREGGLDHVVKSGTIIEAVDNQPWSGEANVHVSIVNWVKTQRETLLPKSRRLWYKVDAPREKTRTRRIGSVPAHKEYELAYRDGAHINSALSDGADLSGAQVLASNRNPKRCFEGQQPGHKGFRLDGPETREINRKSGGACQVVYPYINGTSLLTSQFETSPEFIIDFGNRTLIDAAKYEHVLSLIRERVLPTWEANAIEERKQSERTTGEHQRRLTTWWKLKRQRSALISFLEKLDRYVVCSRVTKRPIFAFISSGFRPDSSLTAFAFDDDYSFGLLQSSTHWQWFIAKCSKLTERFRYTPDSVFDTFPWPQAATRKQVDAVAEAGREVRRVRGDALTKIKGGLRAVYRTLELPGKNPLKDAHAALDAAVLDAYGFATKNDLLQQILDLNLTVADRIDRGETVVAPGIPPYYPNPESLITDDCIRPAAP